MRHLLTMCAALALALSPLFLASSTAAAAPDLPAVAETAPVPETDCYIFSGEGQEVDEMSFDGDCWVESGTGGCDTFSCATSSERCTVTLKYQGNLVASYNAACGGNLVVDHCGSGENAYICVYY